MLWMNHSGAQWRQLPERYGPWQSVYARFAKWRDDGIWEKVFTELSKDADTENLSIDSTCVKVHESSNGREKAENKVAGRTKGGLNTKIHAIVDGLGNPVAFLLSLGNDNDSTHAIKRMSMTDIAGSSLLGDKAYGTKEILAYIVEHGATVVIPPKSNAKNPWAIDDCSYKERTSLNAFSRRSNGFAELLQGMINLTFLFLLLYIWLLS